MRYADVLLIEAEAILGQSASPGVGHGIPMSASTSDATALQYFNMVRTRAHVAPVTSFTYQQLLLERRCEFAFEQDYWFDLGRIDGFNVTSHPTAIAIMSNQERGTYSSTTPPITIYSAHYVPTNAQFYIPVPSAESNSDPNLIKAPVPYVFK